jgi:hypothetical protein
MEDITIKKAPPWGAGGQNCIIFFNASSALTFVYLSDTEECVSQLESVVSFFILISTFIVEFVFPVFPVNDTDCRAGNVFEPKAENVSYFQEALEALAVPVP